MRNKFFLLIYIIWNGIVSRHLLILNSSDRWVCTQILWEGVISSLFLILFMVFNKKDSLTLRKKLGRMFGICMIGSILAVIAHCVFFGYYTIFFVANQAILVAWVLGIIQLLLELGILYRAWFK